jgi:hypothetical protein
MGFSENCDRLCYTQTLNRITKPHLVWSVQNTQVECLTTTTSNHVSRVPNRFLKMSGLSHDNVRELGSQDPDFLEIVSRFHWVFYPPDEF